MEKNNRELALEFAIQCTQGTYEDGVYRAPPVETQIQNAEKFLLFLEGDEING